MNRVLLTLVVFACLSLTACRPKEPSFEDKVAASLAKAGLAAPNATGPTVPLPRDGFLLLFYPDRFAVVSPTAFTVTPGGDVLFSVDPARAGAEGADPKYKRRRTPDDPVIAPLANYILDSLSKGTPKRIIVASAGPPPAQLYKEVIATFEEQGITDRFRIIRGKEGRLAAEPLS
jgi:hypothetical protein